MKKGDWVTLIKNAVHAGRVFVHSSVDDHNAQLLFACDLFRRKNYDVVVSIEPSESGQAILNVVVHPLPSCLYVTLGHKDTLANIVATVGPTTNKLRIRACGTVLDKLLKLTEWCLNNGWYIEKTMMDTLTFPPSLASQVRPKNTTLLIVLRRGLLPTRGLQPDSI